MAVNNTRSMNADLHQGCVDSTYISLTPHRGNVENPPIERMTWPQYGNAEKWADDPHIEAHISRSVLPREIKTTGDGDTRAL
jgi:hypothetical protein